jgi:hypothetical protein
MSFSVVSESESEMCITEQGLVLPLPPALVLQNAIREPDALKELRLLLPLRLILPRVLVWVV